MHAPILVTGSAGLVGRALTRALRGLGRTVHSLDLAAPPGLDRGDVRHARDVARAITGCAGVVHLAAISRVVWGERDPQLCRATNEGGTHNVVAAALAAVPRPWLLFASSREVYGQPDTLPVREDAPLRPVNVYGRTKIAGERLLDDARAAGLTTAVVRLSNVYGCPQDHRDRVVPAFTRAALRGTSPRIEGTDHTFDFTHIDDTIRGLLAAIAALDAGVRGLPALHLLTGVPTTLGELARIALDLAGSAVPPVLAPPRDYDVARFVGDPRRARDVLGWQAQISIRTGVSRLLTALRTESTP